jgi:hypothetical protein
MEQFMENVFDQASIPAGYEIGMMDARKLMLEYDCDHIKLLIGEFDSIDLPGDKTPRRLDRIGNMLAQAGWYHSFMRQGDHILGAHNTEFTPVLPYKLQGDPNPRMFINKLYLEAGDQPVLATVESPVFHNPKRAARWFVPTFNIPYVDVMVVKHPDIGTLSVGMLNRDLVNSRTVRIDLSNYEHTRVAEIFRYEDPGALDEPYAESREGLRREVISVGSNPEVSLSPYSFTMLKLFPVD